MNDPGLDEPAKKAAQDVDQDICEEDHKEAEKEEQDHLDPSRWWFASTAIPLIAGTFGPIANAFSICALVEKWRVHIPSGADEGHAQNVQDPRWLIATNSVSLAFALIANISLLLNMARRLSFSIAQPITIVGWYLASMLLISLVAVASTPAFRLEPRAQHALSQAYYYGIISAALYFVIASLMVMTVIGAYRGHYPKEFRLTPSQRTLMLQTIGFMFYLLLGALIFAYIEDWRFLDAVYWADFTLLTVGIGGEYTPKTHTGRSLIFPYAIGGIVMVGLVIGSVRSLILERGKQKMSARFLETERQKIISSLKGDESSIRLGPLRRIEYSTKGIESQRREQEFRIMRHVQDKAERNRRYVALATSTAAALLLWFLGALVFMHSEKPQGWSYFVSLYFAYTSLLTIGYGDYTLSSNSGKAFFVFWSLLAIPTLTILISNMGDTVIKAFKELTIWIGSISVLPDENGLEAALKTGLKRLKHGKLYKEKDPEENVPGVSEETIIDRLADLLEEDELREAEEAGEHGDYLERDIHFYHFALAKEIRTLMKDTDTSPPKQYTFQEWTYYLRLLGQDEDKISGHREAMMQHDRCGQKSSHLGTADDDDHLSWSWLGIRSPLMSSKTEAQWLLERFSLRLELEMRKMRSSDPMKRKDPPPISMADMMKRRKSLGCEPKQAMDKELSAAEIRRRGNNSV